MNVFLSICLLGLSSVGIAQAATELSAFDPQERFSGGSATVNKFDSNAFSLPSANLAPTRRLDFSVGNSFFRSPWVIAPATTTSRDGLGPLLNTNACQNCHIKDGRGHPPAPDAVNAVSMLVRLSIAGIPADPAQGLVPEPTYGGQLQDMAIPGIAPEGRVRVTYTPVPVSFADGSVLELQQPNLQITDLGYGPMHPDALLSARVAPPMIGLGLLEAIAEQDLLANEDPEDMNADGIRGRANRVWSHEAQALAVGRFGWKAGQPSMRQQNADAFFNDMGLSTPLLSGTACTAQQTDCLAAPHGGEPEVNEKIEAQVLFYSRNLAVPARRNPDSPEVLKGKQLFNQANCQGCHTPRFVTAKEAAESELAEQVIFPYTDLLLHDMGEGLADQRPEFQASGRDWRTPPLWGIGLTEEVSGHTRFLHDGRARNLMEAVLWHSGEAETAKQQVLNFSQSERQALLAFLNSL
ncbi:MAG: di-heme oxidoredictase family protein [Pseudomonas sp.]|nr:di-heme oxidoredictase family protein [Pseudomonas sp.]